MIEGGTRYLYITRRHPDAGIDEHLAMVVSVDDSSRPPAVAADAIRRKGGVATRIR